ncbi:hypothetical protein HXX76_000571 [Chlamydomonas incerta]|uniref:Uncharacterized protein n=1 Tax=Chlamydomonas incerta TaxID=51695 RepID=A0A835WEN2_CHLIN|nr:hypothetical protein HXX76_000571 [Chlamydomonas incerta]|eukprot:KAG2445968.1 hypothetical protein HXX76_000571 [Chlamydomonas incerta]
MNEDEDGLVGTGPQALDILAGLASLGIAPSLREQVQQALADLTHAAGAVAADAAYPDTPGTGARVTSGASASTSTSSAKDSTLQRKIAELEQKMTMSRSIMKKLYHKNVELEKELAVARANQHGVDLVPPPTAGPGSGSSRPGTSIRPSTTASAYGAGDAGPMAQALQERDLTIRQMQQALEAARRRCSLLELQLAGGPAGGGAGPGAGLGAAGGKGVSADSLRDLLAQSALHQQKYKQIREDYNRLLNKRASTVAGGSRSTTATAVAARTLVDDLQKRLAAEVQEREAEAALYSARLYESEKALSDWYVEKRLLEEHIARLSAEVAERDKIDAEIEGCVASLLERLRAVEADNEALRARAVAAGLPVDVGGSGAGEEGDRGTRAGTPARGGAAAGAGANAHKRGSAGADVLVVR